MTAPNETWRQVPEWPAYEVSNLGRVCRGNRYLKPWRLKNGRWQVRLWQGNAGKAFHTYRLVVLAFIGPEPFDGAVIGHIDDDKDNNCLDNLKWCTRRENYDDAIRNGRTARGHRNGAYTQPHRRRSGELNGTSKLTWAKVSEIRRLPGSCDVLAARFGVSRTTIKDVRKGKTWRAA